MPKSKQFLFFSLNFIIGIGVVSYWTLPFFAWYCFGLVVFLIAVLLWRHSAARMVALGGIFLFLGVVRYEASFPKIDEGHIAYYNDGGKVEFIGRVAEEPDVRVDKAKITVEVIGTPVETPRRDVGASLRGVRRVTGKVLINTGLYPEYSYGDVVQISGKLRSPVPIEDFDYEKYLARYGIYSVSYFPEIRILQRGAGSGIFRSIFSVKQSFIENINRILPEPHASFLSAVLIGARKGIPEKLQESFRITGTSHIVAISGYNITIIASILLVLAIRMGLKRQQAFCAVATIIALFVILTGAQASVVRAGIMGLLVLVAQNIGRLSSPILLLTASGLAMLLINPKLLVFDVGFQLSFLSTAGLLYINPILSRWLKRLPDFFGSKEALLTTLSATAATLPLIIFQFHRVSVISPVANLLILPFIPWVMLFGFIAGVVGFLNTAISSVFIFPAWVLLSYIIIVIQWLGGLPWAAVGGGT